jgi:EpsI family protein
MSHFRGVAAVLAVVLGGALLTLIFWKPVMKLSRVSITRADLPESVAGYRAAGDQKTDPTVLAALPGATVLSRSYAAAGGNGIDFTMVGATSRNGIHDPRLCLTGAGWRISDEHSEHLPGTDVTMQVCHAATQSGPPDTLVGYFYVVGNRVISSPTEIRTALLWSALLGRQSAPTYFFRFLLPLGSDRAASQAQDAQMHEFAAQMWQDMRPKVEPIISAQEPPIRPSATFPLSALRARQCVDGRKGADKGAAVLYIVS